MSHTDSDLVNGLAEMLYDRSIAGRARDEAPAWLDTPYEIRNHWLDIARHAVLYVRLMELNG